MKLFQYSIKPKKENEPFKPIITEDVITEESKEIEEYVKIKIQNNVSNTSSLSSSSDEGSNKSQSPRIEPPPIPEKPKRTEKPALKPKPSLSNKKATIHIVKDEDKVKLEYGLTHPNKSKLIFF